MTDTSTEAVGVMCQDLIAGNYSQEFGEVPLLRDLAAERDALQEKLDRAVEIVERIACQDLRLGSMCDFQDAFKFAVRDARATLKEIQGNP